MLIAFAETVDKPNNITAAVKADAILLLTLKFFFLPFFSLKLIS